MARWEVQVQRRKKTDEPDWESLGMKRPKDYPKGEIYYRRMYVHTDDIEYLEHLTKDETILKCTWMEAAVIIKGSYDDLVIDLNDREEAQIEDPEEEPVSTTPVPEPDDE